MEKSKNPVILNIQRVFKNRVLRRIFRPKQEEAKGHWRELKNEDIQNLYCSLNNIKLIKSRTMTWVRHLA
jgi:hypothetical protein